MGSRTRELMDVCGNLNKSAEITRKVARSHARRSAKDLNVEMAVYFFFMHTVEVKIILLCEGFYFYCSYTCVHI